MQDLYENNPVKVPIDIGLAKANIDVMYPYWVAIIFENMFMDAIDEWICKTNIYSDELCAGIQRLIEYNKLGSEWYRLRCIDGEITELKK